MTPVTATDQEGQPLVSVIMPCYNSAATIETAIGAVQAQTEEDWELLVVDDGSTDDSRAVVESLCEPRIRLIVQANAGPSAARNRGIRAARGCYLAFLDADDTWEPTLLEKLAGALQQNPAAVLSYCGWQNLGVEGGRGEPFIPPDYNPMDRAEMLLGGCRWPIHAVMVPTPRIQEAGGFDESLITSEDYDLWMRIADEGDIVRVPEVLAYYHHHGDGQITGNALRVAVNHWRAQQKFITRHPEVVGRLGRGRVRELVIGELLQRAYKCYWGRDLPTARILFRRVMRAGYGRPRDWFYMLPALLPLTLHTWLVNYRDRT